MPAEGVVIPFCDSPTDEDYVGQQTHINLINSARRLMCEEVPSTDVLFYTAMKAAKEHMKLSPGDEIVITGGITNGRSGNTNLLKVETI